MRAALRIGGGVACLAAAAVALLLALDVRAWPGRLAADDVRFRSAPVTSGLWRPRQLVPFDAAQRLLGLGSALQYRRALRSWRLSRPLVGVFTPDVAANRIDAQVALTAAARDVHGPVPRAQLANLLGVLETALATGDSRVTRAFTRGAVASFVRAGELDERDDAPKYNLEYELNRLKDEEGQEQSGTGRQGGTGQAGLDDPGRGY